MSICVCYANIKYETCTMNFNATDTFVGTHIIIIVLWVIGSIPHDGPIELFLITASVP